MVCPDGRVNATIPTPSAAPNEEGVLDAATYLEGIKSGAIVLTDAQLGNMALRAKQQRTKAEQDKQLLQVRGGGGSPPSALAASSPFFRHKVPPLSVPICVIVLCALAESHQQTASRGGARDEAHRGDQAPR